MKTGAAETVPGASGKVDREGAIRSLCRRAMNHPDLAYWAGLLLAFAVLYQRLTSAGERTLQFWFNSDYLFAADIYKDVFVDHFPLSGIKFSIAPCLFPDVVFTSFLMVLTRNAVLATFLYGLVQFTLLVSAYILLAGLLERRQSHAPRAFILTVAIALVLYTSSILHRPYDTLYYLFLDESHVSSFAMVL